MEKAIRPEDSQNRKATEGEDDVVDGKTSTEGTRLALNPVTKEPSARTHGSGLQEESSHVTKGVGPSMKEVELKPKVGERVEVWLARVEESALVVLEAAIEHHSVHAPVQVGTTERHSAQSRIGGGRQGGGGVEDRSREIGRARKGKIGCTGGSGRCGRGGGAYRCLRKSLRSSTR